MYSIVKHHKVLPHSVTTRAEKSQLHLRLTVCPSHAVLTTLAAWLNKTTGQKPFQATFQK